MIESARHFLGAARLSVANGYARPSIDALFSACELLSKAQLILHRSSAAKAKTHRRIGAAINAWGRLGNVDEDFLRLYNRMAQERAPARYDAAATIAAPTDEDFKIAKRELDQLHRRVAHRISGGPQEEENDG